MLGPTGVGILWGRRELLKALPPFLGGGDMIEEVHFTGFTPNQIPHKFEAGTPNVAGVIALGATVKYLNQIGMENIRKHDQELVGYALEKLKEIEAVTIYGPENVEQRSSLISFNVGGIHAHDLASVLDTEGVAIRSGHHCAQPLVNEVLKVPAVARASFYFYNTKEEVDQLILGIHKAKKIFSLK